MPQIDVGIYEVGRGALAGPLVVGAVALSAEAVDCFVSDLLIAVQQKQLKDSKQLTSQQRERIFEYILPYPIWSIGQAEAWEIDQLGLRKAADLAAGRALDALNIPYDRVLADAGLHHPYEETIPTEFFIKGDERIPQIALASCMAKVTRDQMMHGLSARFADYGWITNVGYGTAAHYAALGRLGPSSEHRRLFLRKLVKKATSGIPIAVSK